MQRFRLTSTGFPMLKLSRSRDLLIFNTGIPYPERRSLYLDGAQFAVVGNASHIVTDTRPDANVGAMQPWFPSHSLHEDVIKWKHFPRYWPFVRGIHRSGEFPAQKPVARSFDVFFDRRLNKRLSKHNNIIICLFRTRGTIMKWYKYKWRICQNITIHMHHIWAVHRVTRVRIHLSFK